MVVGYRWLWRWMRRLLARLILALLGQIPNLVSEDPTDGADGGQVELIANPVGE